MAKRQASLLSYPEGATFGQLLKWHLAWGTRPGCSITEQNAPWIENYFTQIVHGIDPEAPATRPKHRRVESAKKNLRNWKNGKLPEDKTGQDRIENIFRELFGDEANLQHWKADLERALTQGRKMQVARIAKRETAKPYTVPCPTPYFTGRNEDAERLAGAILAGTSAILVQGGPGIGKTELTKAVAHHPDIVEAFAERRWFVPLATSHSAQEMKDAITQALGCLPSDFPFGLCAQPAVPSLLVLDNLETPWEVAEEQEAVEEVLADLAALPGLVLLASMRGLETMRQPRWLPQPLPVLSPDHASELFAALAGPQVLTDPVLGDFLKALGGLPLAIDLVARRAHGRGDLAPLWQEWNRIGTDFAEKHGRPEGPLTSLSRSIALSLDSPRVTNTPNALRLFDLLGRLPNGIARDDCNALFDGKGYNSEEILFKSGLSIEINGRIDLLAPMREYAIGYRAAHNADLLELSMRYICLLKFAANGQQDERGMPFQSRVAVELYNMMSIFCLQIDNGEYRHIAESVNYFRIITWLPRFFSEILFRVMSLCRDNSDHIDELNVALCLAEDCYDYPDKEYPKKLLERCLDLIKLSGNRSEEMNIRIMLAQIEEETS